MKTLSYAEQQEADRLYREALETLTEALCEQRKAQAAFKLALRRERNAPTVTHFRERRLALETRDYANKKLEEARAKCDEQLLAAAARRSEYWASLVG